MHTYMQPRFRYKSRPIVQVPSLHPLSALAGGPLNCKHND